MLVLILASILPGAGHLSLGRKCEGLWLLGSFLFGQIVAGGAHFWGMGPVSWLALRALILVYLYGVVDAALLQVEIGDGRDGSAEGAVRPRNAAFGNLVLYGFGYWRLEERGLAAVAIAFGVLVHVLVADIHILLRLLSEICVAGLAVHGYKMAADAVAPRDRKSLDFEPRARTTDSTPGWLMPTLGVFCVVQVALFGFVYHVGNGLNSAMEVDQGQSLSVEPYYRNSDYGVQLELNSPGWSFLAASEDEFVHARHVSEGSTMRLMLRPRLWGFPDDKSYAQLVMGEAMVQGRIIEEIESGPARIAGLDGWRVRARSYVGREARNLEIRTAGESWYQFVLWFEWAEDDSHFGERELAHLVAGLQLANSKEPDAELAR